MFVISLTSSFLARRLQPQPFQHLLHIMRDRSDEFNAVTGPRMNKSQTMGMKGLVLQFLYPTSEDGVLDGPRSPFSSVERITEKRMSHRGEVDPDLMGPSGLRVDLKKRETVEPFPHFPRRGGGPASPRMGGHPFPFAWVSTDFGIDDPFVPVEFTRGDGQIGLHDGPVLKLPYQMVIGLVIFGDHHDAGRAFIQAMDDSGSQNAVDSGEIFAVIKEGIHQRA